MHSCFAGSVSKCWNFSTRQSLIGFDASMKSPLLGNLRHQHRWMRTHFPLLRQFEKTRPHRVPVRSYASSSSSSSSSSYKTRGFLGWYLGLLNSRPLTTKTVTTSLIYIAADLSSQMIASPSFGSFDLIRTLRMAGYGLLILGPAQHVWFNFVSRVLPNRDIFSTLKKILMGQALFGPCITAIFFSYNAGLQGESGVEILARLKRDLLKTLISGLIYWPLCDFVTFKFVPVHLQPLVNSSCAYFWTIYLTYMASLQKVSTD